MMETTRVFQTAEETQYLVFAEGKFGKNTSKTANVLLRYQPERVCAVVDSRYAGQSVSQRNQSLQSDIPIVESVEAGMDYSPTHLVIGVAPAGGQLPESWIKPIKTAIKNGLEIVSGLHTYLSENQELALLADKHNVSIIDLRKPPEFSEISQGYWREREIPVLLTIAPDCAMGKFTASWELKAQLEKRGYQVGFVATGQTGILLQGEGLVIDAIRGDFMSVAVEQLIMREIENGADIVLVEGQGAIYHEAYSSVTLGIVHGAMPEAFLFVHRPGIHCNDYGYEFPPYRQMINDYERLVEWFKPVHTIGVQLNTTDFDQETAKSLCEKISHLTGLPTTDLVRFPEDEAINQMIHKLYLQE